MNTLPLSYMQARIRLLFLPLKRRGRWKRSASRSFLLNDGPGAREAGAIHFIDYALSQTEPHLQPDFRAGLKELAAACAPDKFNELGAPQQIAVLKKLESTEFFTRALQYTILGFLGNPVRHGNREQVGWKYIGFENPGMFTHPFGFYDAEYLSEKKKDQ